MKKAVFDGLRAGIRRFDQDNLPRLDGVFNLAGLSAMVEILRDRWGVPHIFAKGRNDAFFGQGFVHAQDRFGQMELFRRFGHGTLAEKFGPSALGSDRASRILGFKQTARQDLADAGQDLTQSLASYASGVNAYIESSDFKKPVELVLGGIKPEPWTPLDSLVFGRVMYWQLCRGWANEVIRAMLVDAVGPEFANWLEIDPPRENPPHLPNGIEINELDPKALLPTHGPMLKRGLGSNSWAISGTLTSSGQPLLANDMHLPLMLPSFWYEVHLCAPDINVAGVSLPGLPMVMGGHNARIAWGMTLAHTDAEDTFVERFAPDDETLYRTPNGWERAVVRNERIRVKGAPDHIERVVETRHGPVIGRFIGLADDGLTIQSTALVPSKAAEGFLALNLAKDWTDFENAVALITTPPLNVTYADVDGNIGYRTAGHVPIRTSGRGSLPSQGWTGEGDWTGFIPFEQMPHAKNPAQGYVVSANHRIVKDDYLYHLGDCFMNGYRARRISELIEESVPHDINDSKRIHRDALSLPALELQKRLRGHVATPENRKILDDLLAWDGHVKAESTGAAIYGVFRYKFIREIVEPTLGKKLTNHFLGTGFDPVINQSNEYYGHDTVTMLRLLDHPESPWIIKAGGTAAVVERVLTKTRLELEQTRRINNGRTVTWGTIHGAVFAHSLAAEPPMDAIFNLGPYPIDGDSDTANQTALMPDNPYDATAWAPTYRLIVDLSDLDNSLIIHAPGQSGRPASPHYDDLTDLWLKGNYHPMAWSRPRIESVTAHRSVLVKSAT